MNREAGGAFGDAKATSQAAEEFRASIEKEEQEKQEQGGGDGAHENVADMLSITKKRGIDRDEEARNEALQKELREQFAAAGEGQGSSEGETSGEGKGEGLTEEEPNQDTMIMQNGWGLYDMLVRINEDGEIARLKLDVLKKNEKRSPI